MSSKESIFYFVYNYDNEEYILQELNLISNTTRDRSKFNQSQKFGSYICDIQIGQNKDNGKHEDDFMSKTYFAIVST